MKKMKYMSLLMALVSVMTIGFTSCSSDDDDTPAKPVVNLTEVGHANAKHAHPGHDLHLEAKVVAEGIIKRIDIEIHQEGGGSFKIEQSFTQGKYIGVRNVEFHEHIDIPAETPLGKYHMHFTVTDQRGQQTTAESHLEVIKDDGNENHEHQHK